MIAELGFFSLILALCVSLALASIPIIGAARGMDNWMALARPATYAQAMFVFFSFGCLTYTFVVSDFRCSTWPKTQTVRCR